MKSPMNTDIDHSISIYLFNSQSDKPYPNTYWLKYSQIFQEHVNSPKE